MVRALALLLVLAGLTLAACGEDETTTTPATTAPPATTTGATGEDGETGTGTGSGTAPTGSAKDVAAEIEKCLIQEANMAVTEGPSDLGKAELLLVVNGGQVGVVYVYENEADAKAGVADVEEFEATGSNRQAEAVGQTVIAYLPEDATLTPSEEELSAFTGCVGA